MPGGRLADLTPAYVTYTRSAFEMLGEQGAASVSMRYPLLSFRIKFLCCALVLPIFFPVAIKCLPGNHFWIPLCSAPDLEPFSFGSVVRIQPSLQVL